MGSGVAGSSDAAVGAGAVVAAGSSEPQSNADMPSNARAHTIRITWTNFTFSIRYIPKIRMPRPNMRRNTYPLD